MKIKILSLAVAMILLCLVNLSFAALEAPVLSSSTDGLDITLDWASVPDATGYRLYYVAVASYSGPESVSSIDLGVSTTFSYTLWDGASYYLAVTAYNDQESSFYSNIEVINIEVFSIPPEAPELSVSTSGLDLSLSWNAVPDATGYILNYAPSPYSGPESFTTMDVGTDTSFSINLWDGAAFTVAVQAYNDQGVSFYSNIESFTIGQALPGLSDSFYGLYRFTNGAICGEASEFIITDDESLKNGDAFVFWVPRDTMNTTYSGIDKDGDNYTRTMTISANEVHISEVGEDWTDELTFDFENMTFSSEDCNNYLTFVKVSDSDLMPTVFTVDWLSGKTLYTVWFGGTDLGNDAVGVNELVFNSNQTITATSLLNSDSENGTFAYAVTDGALHGADDSSGRSTITCTTSDYLQIEYTINGEFDNVDRYYFDKSSALAYASTLTDQIPRICN